MIGRAAALVLLVLVSVGCSTPPCKTDPLEIEDGTFVEDVPATTTTADTPFPEVVPDHEPAILEVAGDTVELEYLDAEGRTVRVRYAAEPVGTVE